MRITGIFLTGASLAACKGQQKPRQAIQGSPIPISDQYPEVPFAPEVSPPTTILLVLEPHEAETVDALTARIFPGDPPIRALTRQW